jgi:hypothetical protein
MKRLIHIILETGRHTHTSILITGHQLIDGQNTKTILNEATHIVFFKTNAFATIDKFLKDKQGYNKKQRDRIRNLKSRWVCLRCLYPQFVFYDHGIYIP